MVMGARFVVTDTLCLRLLQQIKKWGGRRDSKSLLYKILMVPNKFACLLYTQINIHRYFNNFKDIISLLPLLSCYQSPRDFIVSR